MESTSACASSIELVSIQWKPLFGNLLGECWAEIHQLVLTKSSSSLHCEACVSTTSGNIDELLFPHLRQDELSKREHGSICVVPFFKIVASKLQLANSAHGELKSGCLFHIAGQTKSIRANESGGFERFK